MDSKTAAAPPQQFCVRWNSYQSNLQNAFPKLLTSEHFVDVTLACENEMLKCHKVVLSACSTYFEKLLLDNPCQHPIIFMKDMKFGEMQSLVDFMYKGEVNVTQDDLPSLLKSAEALQIRGLCGSDQLLNAHNFPNSLSKAAGGGGGEAAAASVKSGEPSSAANAVNSKDAAAAGVNAANDGDSKVTAAAAGGGGGGTTSSDDCDSSDGMLQIKEDDICDEDDSYFDGDGLMDTEFCEEDGVVNTGGGGGGAVGVATATLDATPIKAETPEFAIANVSCQYDGAPGSANRRIRRSDEELRRAAECITRGQTFQTVSDQFNIPISTIRFYMARKGILPRRKRGRACAVPSMGVALPTSSHHYIPSSASVTPAQLVGGGTGGAAGGGGSTSPIGPPYHIVHYKLPQLGVSKLK